MNERTFSISIRKGKFEMVSIITGRNEVVAKVMFLQVSVILLTGGCLPQCMLGYHPQSRPPPGSRLWHTVNEWPVRILLECILVYGMIGHNLLDKINIFWKKFCSWAVYLQYSTYWPDVFWTKVSI